MAIRPVQSWTKSTPDSCGNSAASLRRAQERWTRLELRAQICGTLLKSAIKTVLLRIQSTRLPSKQFLEANVDLMAGWTNHRVALSSFRLTGSPSAPPDSASLATLLESCSGIAWSFGPEGSLDLDDVLLDGVDANSIWGPLRIP